MSALDELIKALGEIEPEALASLPPDQFARRLARYEALLPPARAEIAQLLSSLSDVKSGHGD